MSDFIRRSELAVTSEARIVPEVEIAYPVPFPGPTVNVLLFVPVVLVTVNVELPLFIDVAATFPDTFNVDPFHVNPLFAFTVATVDVVVNS